MKDPNRPAMHEKIPVYRGGPNGKPTVTMETSAETRARLRRQRKGESE